jgi:hypothetical protein
MSFMVNEAREVERLIIVLIRNEGIKLLYHGSSRFMPPRAQTPISQPII